MSSLISPSCLSPSTKVLYLSEQVEDIGSLSTRQYSLESPSLSWSSLQTELEDAIPHVLIILDCYYAANATGNLIASKTTKEILAACSRECPIRSSGNRSYTSALVDELTHIGNLDSNRERVSAAMLHSRLMSVKGRLSYTPTYTLLSENGGSSIVLAPRSMVAAPSPRVPFISSTSSTQTSRSLELEHLEDGLQLSRCSSRSSYAEETKVLIAVSIADITPPSLVPDVNAWRRWLTTETPLEIRNIDIQLQNVYHSHSLLAIFSIPVVVWTRLPDQAAYRFIGYMTRPCNKWKNEYPTPLTSRVKTYSSRGEKPKSFGAPWGPPRPSTEDNIGLSGYARDRPSRTFLSSDIPQYTDPDTMTVDEDYDPTDKFVRGPLPSVYSPYYKPTNESRSMGASSPLVADNSLSTEQIVAKQII